MSFVNERAVKALRKDATCCACSRKIHAGEPAVRWAGVIDGDFASVAYHPDCRAAEIAYNAICDTNADEWLSFRDMEEDDHVWLAEEHPTVAARLGLTPQPDARKDPR